MNNKIKRFTQILLTTLMLLSLIPMTPINADANQINESKPAQEALEASDPADTQERNGNNNPSNGQARPEIIDVVVPTLWIPVNKDTNEVLGYLNPMPTYPNMYPRSEVAKLNAEEVYEIDYMGVPKPAPGAWSANNFMYTANLFFTNKFHRIVAQGRDERNFGEEVSAVRKLEYGSFTDESVFNTSTGKYTGLHGMTKTPYQDGETMKLYIATETENTSISDPVFVNEILDIVYTGDNEDLVTKLYNNIEEVKFNDFDNQARITILDGINDQDGVRARLEKIYLYKYTDGVDSTGSFISDDTGYRDFKSTGFSGVESGIYEVVLPIYWNRNVPDYMSAPDVFSRNRYQYDDTIHFTMNLTVSEPLKVTLSDATITRGTSIALGSGGYGGNLMTITGGTQDPTNDQRDLTYSWSIKDQDEFSTVENPEVSPRVDTEYRVIIEDDYGCTATATMMVFVRAPYVPPTPETVDIAANKVWVGGPAVKPTIELQLYRNDEVVDGRLATLENGTTAYTWNGLRRYDPAGVEYIYTVKEVTQLDNYTKVEVGLTVTNTFIEEVERVDITGNKIWILGPEIKPVIELQLYRNGIAYGDPVELLDGTTSYTWTGLEKVDIEGNDYTYTIDEVSTPENYDKLVSDDGLTVTNIFFEVAGDVVIDDTEKPPVDKTPPTGINNFISLYTTTLVLGSAGLIYLAKRKEEEF